MSFCKIILMGREHQQRREVWWPGREEGEDGGIKRQTWRKNWERIEES